jgi:hypothetical protein
MAKLSGERRRALEILAGSPDGCTASLMMAHKFFPELLADLVRMGLAVSKPATVRAGGGPIEVVRLQITEAGRKAIAGN